jgi:hypothetical protein
VVEAVKGLYRIAFGVIVVAEFVFAFHGLFRVRVALEQVLLPDVEAGEGIFFFFGKVWVFIHDVRLMLG